MADGEEKQRQFPEKKQIRQQTAQPKRRSKSWGDMKRYESLARNISDSILTGVLKFGDQLPSVRQASSSRGVSASTVFKAYYLLEAQGLIAARERQGYFVIASPRGMPPQPKPPPSRLRRARRSMSANWSSRSWRRQARERWCRSDRRSPAPCYFPPPR